METQRRRPVWLATTLSFLSGGLYYVWWFGATWSELKRELRDDAMYPVWHALTSLVPIYATFRTHAHFRSIDAAAAKAGLTLRSGVNVATVLNAGTWIFGVAGLFLSGAVQAVLFVIASALYGTLTYQGQWALDAYWAGLSGRSIPERTHGFEWFALAVSVPIFLAVIASSFLTLP